ncbi:MAG: P-loop NTPase [Bdellovibrionales bacterium]|jgi:flagellar biosynthesis protein FlhG|nr:P-loop NTPase [Bdellovibrionales bacterium]
MSQSNVSQFKPNPRGQNPGQSFSPTAIWAIGGGKGGIGKSFISSSLAICLTKLGKSVTLVDLDLGSANLHTCLGLKIPSQTLSDFISGRVHDLNEISVPTEINGLNFISGFNDALNIADLDRNHKERLIHALRSIRTPYVILDLGAGTREPTLDYYLAADQTIDAVTPEPTSIENANRFMKSGFYRKLRQAESELGIQHLIEAAMDTRNELGIRSPADLIRHISQTNPHAGQRLLESVSDFQLQLLLNQVRTRQDIELGHSIKSVCKKYFGIEANYLGYIDHDNAVWQSLRKRRPLVMEYPYSSIVGQFLGMTKNLLNPTPLRAVI